MIVLLVVLKFVFVIKYNIFYEFKQKSQYSIDIMMPQKTFQSLEASALREYFKRLSERISKNNTWKQVLFKYFSENTEFKLIPLAKNSINFF